MKYVLIDAAIIGNEMYHLKKMNTNHQSLYMGKTGALMDSVAPFLFQVKSKDPFSEWFMQFAADNPCGYIVDANCSFKDLHHHFRKFLKVQTEAGKKLYFRFYDPRVLPTFLKTSTADQLKEFFGPITGFTIVVAQNHYLNFYLKDNKLVEEDIMLD